MEVSSPFNRWRRYLWPIHGYEIKKFLPLLLMAFLIGFAFNILRNMKDSLLVTAAGSGAEVLPFVKVWAMLPMAIIITSIFVKASHRYSTERVFYGVISSFVGFFLIFAFILYPLRDHIHPHGMVEALQDHMPRGLNGLMAMIRYWSFSLFYGFAELWGTVVLSVLFWGFANEVSNVSEAARFYGLLGIGANFASISSGQVSRWLCQRDFNPNWIIGEDKWHQALILLTICVAVSGFLVMMIFNWFTRNVVSPSQLHGSGPAPSVSKLESKGGGIRKHFAFLFRSRYLLSVGMIVFSYNLFINLTEVIWKDKVRALYPEPTDFFSYMSTVTSVTGVIATLMAIVGSGNIIRKFGWRFGALVTPVVLVITSIGFFGFYLFPDDKLAGLTALLGMTPTALIVFFGSAQNILSRGAKYSIFDATKELAFIPLTREMRVKGKAAIDGVISRIGKSSGSVMYQGLFLVLDGLARTVPFVTGILVLVLTGWIASVRSLGRKFGRLTAEQEAAAAEPEPAPLTEPQAV
jgi:ATP:ADP antiporter, AAA family